MANPIKVAILLLLLFFVILGLNYRQLYSAWAIRSETRRLAEVAANAPAEFRNPPPVEDDFQGGLSPDFWKFTIINGNGQVSNGMAWHAAAMTFEHSLTLQHFSDPYFNKESSRWHRPAPDQYNNVALIGRSGFRPSPSRDVVLKFTARVDPAFYGTAGVVFEPADMIGKDGFTVKPFDMFGFSIAGKESSITGINGPLCYLALKLMPVQVKPLQVADPQNLHAYEIRLHWLNQTEWLGTIKVDDTTQCQITMPALGPVEVQVWSDNALVVHTPRRWWEIAPAMGLKFQDGGFKQFSLGTIQLFEAEP